MSGYCGILGVGRSLTEMAPEARPGLCLREKPPGARRLFDGRWWLHIPSDDTKSRRTEERQVPEFITDVVNRYINTHRPVLCRGVAEQLALWVSSTTGRQLTVKNLGTLISKITREAIGVDVSPHLFRTAGASTAAVHGGNHPPRQRGG